MSGLNIAKRQSGDVTIVDLDGKIGIGETNRQLHETIREIAADGTKKVVLNLKGVTAIDSSGLGEIVAGYSTLSAAGGALKLINMTGSCRCWRPVCGRNALLLARSFDGIP